MAEAKKNFGYFALIGNDAIDAAKALTLYRNKDVVEKSFDNVKDRLDMKRMNVSSDLSLDGYAPQIGEMTKKQRELYETLGFPPPNSSLC